MKILKEGDSKIIKRRLDERRDFIQVVKCLCWEGDKVACLICGCKIQLTLVDHVKNPPEGGTIHRLDCPSCDSEITFRCKREKKNERKLNKQKEPKVSWPCIGLDTYFSSWTQSR